jgi:transposase
MRAPGIVEGNPRADPRLGLAAALRALLLAERARHAEAIAQVEQECDSAIGESARLRAIIQALQRYRFGRRSEQLDPDQLALGLEDTEQALSAAEAKEDAARPAHARSTRRRINRSALPKSLPRIETVIDIEGRSCPCCGGAVHAIGEDVAERLDVIPGRSGFWSCAVPSMPAGVAQAR